MVKKLKRFFAMTLVASMFMSQSSVAAFADELQIATSGNASYKISTDSNSESEPVTGSNASLENGTVNIQGKQPMMFGMRGMLPDTVEVTDLQLVSVIDGTPVWDENDNSPNNQVVRNLDTVTYNLRMAIQEPDELTRENETDRIEFKTVIPNVEEGQIAFLTDEMDWLSSPEVNYVEDDLILTGYTYVDADEESVYWQDMSVPFRVAMDNGDEFTPSFYARVEGQKDYVEATILEDVNPTVEVVAKEALNLSLLFDSNINNKYYDIPTDSDTVNDTYGYMLGLTLRMELMSGNNSLKGVKLPEGDLEFVIDLSVLDANKNDVTSKHLPVLWDYHQAIEDEEVVGKLGREIETKVNGKSLLPYGKYDPDNNTQENSVYDSGDIDVVLKMVPKDSANPDSQKIPRLYVKIENYKFSPDLVFPQYTQYGNTYGSGSVKGAFSVAMIQLFVPVDYSKRTTDLTLKAEQRDLSLGENDVLVKQMSSSDDVTSRKLQETYGKWNHYIIYAHENQLEISSDYIELSNEAYATAKQGNQYAYPGEKLYLMGSFGSFNGTPIVGMDYLIKIPESIILPDLDEIEICHVPSNLLSVESQRYYSKSESQFDDYKIWYAVRTNGWGDWDNSTEQEKNAIEDLMDKTYIHELEYYDKKDDIPSGKKIVGLLFELRDGKQENLNFREAFVIPITVSPAEDNIGYVYPTYHENFAYILSKDLVEKEGLTLNDGIRHYNDSTLSKMNQNIRSSYNEVLARGHSQSGATTLIEGVEVEGFLHTYVKSQYKDGVISGHTARPNTFGYFGGNSLLIVGAQSTVESRVEQVDGNDEARVIYNLNQGHREVDYAIDPRYEFTFKNNLNDELDTLVITSILDKGLTYKPESAFQGGSYDAETEALSGGIRLEPEISTDSSGRTVLTWRLEDRKTGEEIETIHYSCLIDETVTDGTQLKNTVRITCSSDVRPVNTFTRKESVTSIQVAQSQGSVLAKHVDRYYAELKDTVTYDLTFNNNGSVDYEDVLLRDILPYEGDGRGTDFKGGTYKVIGISGVDLTSDEIYVSKLDPQDLIEIKLEDMYMDTARQIYWSGWTKYQDGDSLDGVTAIAWRGKAEANEEIAIKIEIEIECPVTRAVFANNAEAYTIAVKEGDHQKLTSLKVKTTVLPRKLSGLAWFDADEDGSRDSGEALLAGVKVTLLDKEGNAVKDIYGNAVDAVVTGNDGAYSFDNLAAGEYQVKFESDTYKLDSLVVTAMDAADDAVDSDAVAVYEGETLKAAVIAGIDLPELDEIAEKNLDEWHEAHLDAGFHNPKKPEDPTEPSEPETNPSEPETTPSNPTPAPKDDDDDDDKPVKPTTPTEPTVPETTPQETVTDVITEIVPETTPLPEVSPDADPEDIPQEVLDAYYERYIKGDIDLDDIPVGVLGAFYEKGLLAAAPHTGDPSNIWTIMMLISMLGLAVTSVIDRKRVRK